MTDGKAGLSVFILLVFLLMFFNTVKSQNEQTPSVKKISICEFYIQKGFISQYNPNNILTDFKALTPQSGLLKSDFTGYTYSSMFGFTTNPLFSFMVGIKFSNKQKTIYKTNPQLRLGVSYFLEPGLTGNLYKEERKPYDTLTSAQTGQTFYIASVNTSSYTINYTSQQIRFDGSLIYRTHLYSRWSLFAGLGIMAGTSLEAYTDISYMNSKRNSNFIMKQDRVLIS